MAALCNIPRESLYDLYIIQSKSIIEVSKALNHTRRTIINYLDRYSIPRRTLKEANGLIDRKGINNPCYRHGRCNNTFCIDCGIKIVNIYAQRCNSCDNRGCRNSS